MRWLILIACACGGGARTRAIEAQNQSPPPVTLEWKVEQGDGNYVNVSLGLTAVVAPR